jgi:thiol-disulfide isomerase/thioredoxin
LAAILAWSFLMTSTVARPWALFLAAAFALLPCTLPSAAADDGTGSPAIKLQSLKWAEFKDRVLANKQAKYTLVDAWATTCGPCKENFPHLVEMHHKYGSKGLAVVSLSLDDPTDATAVAAAEKFLKEKKAVMTNVLLNEDYGDGFDKLAISAIPAVFLYGPDGKEVKRFTMDDPNNQFTYEQVEKEVRNLLEHSAAAK